MYTVLHGMLESTGIEIVLIFNVNITLLDIILRVKRNELLNNKSFEITRRY